MVSLCCSSRCLRGDSGLLHLPPDLRGSYI
ncbi:hypothetical protein LEMLEM_LOCUS22935 [Lemmus lemmus]